MNGSSTRRYLKELCHQLDEGWDLERLRKIVVTLAIPAVTFSTACYDPWVYEAYGVPYEEEVSCSDGVDDNWDGRVDCDDPGCATQEVCLGCFDGLDNDGDGRADCNDLTCLEGEACRSTQACSDDEDNDGDGMTDCSDPNCAGSEACP